MAHQFSCNDEHADGAINQYYWCYFSGTCGRSGVRSFCTCKCLLSGHLYAGIWFQSRFTGHDCPQERGAKIQRNGKNLFPRSILFERVGRILKFYFLCVVTCYLEVFLFILQRFIKLWSTIWSGDVSACYSLFRFLHFALSLLGLRKREYCRGQLLSQFLSTSHVITCLFSVLIGGFQGRQ